MQETMKNLITFGDSFAKYAWPMWPELLSQAYDRTLNYGRAGCGNFYIFNSFMQHYIKHGFGHTDTVIIQWTEPKRHDYITHEWVCEGIRSAELIYEHDLPDIISDETVKLKQLTYMTTVASLLAPTGCKWIFLFLNEQSIVHNDATNFNLLPPIRDRYTTLTSFLNEFKDNIVDSESMDDYFVKIKSPIMECSTVIDGKSVTFMDSHPTPRYTFEYLENFVIPKLDLVDTELSQLSKFAIHVATDLDSLAPNHKYNQTKVGTYFEKFIELNNYKPVEFLR